MSCPDCGGNCAPECGQHPEGCVYGGFSCGYWMIVEGCKLEHWERHIVLANDHCACGTHYPGAAGPCAVEFDATAEDVHA
jgi:hypothetical protein